MPSRYASAKNSIAECDRCGFRYKLTELKNLVIKTKNVSIKVCPECWEPDQPQLQLGLYPVNDPQAVREPRPDTSYYEDGNNGAGGSRVIEWGWNPVGGSRNFDSALTPNALVGLAQLGTINTTAAALATSFAMTAGTAYGSDAGYAIYGFAANDYINNVDINGYYGPCGTATPTSVLGYTLEDCYYEDSNGTPNFLFALSGFTSDPGKAFFNSITVNGHTLLTATSTYSSGFDGVFYSIWNWYGVTTGLVNGQTYTVTLA